MFIIIIIIIIIIIKQPQSTELGQCTLVAEVNTDQLLFVRTLAVTLPQRWLYVYSPWWPR